MRLLYPLFFIILLAISAATWINYFVFSDPKEEAVSFLNDVKEGSLVKSVKHFGGNACRCPAKGGWGSYLIYASGQEPNLAFMTGHPFQMGEAKKTDVKNSRLSFIPWEKPQDEAVDVPISFDPAKYAPLFLPLEMAYGHKMTEAEFNDFLKDPDQNTWKGFTLRFRPSITPGSTAPPSEQLPPEAAVEFEALRKDKKKDDPANDSTTEDIRKTLGADATEYLVPKDVGDVVRPDGTKLSIDEIAAKLPRLQSATLRLHVVRRGQLKDWTVYHFGLMNPILTEGSRTIEIIHDRRPE